MKAIYFKKYSSTQKFNQTVFMVLIFCIKLFCNIYTHLFRNFLLLHLENKHNLCVLSVDTSFVGKKPHNFNIYGFYWTIKIIIYLIVPLVFLQWYVQHYAERQQIRAASLSTQPERVTLVPFSERPDWAAPPDADAAEHTALAGRCGFGKVLWQPVSRPTLCSVPHNYIPPWP